MTLDKLEDVACALNVLGDVSCQIESNPSDSGHVSLYVLWKGEPFLRVYDDRDDITYYNLNNAGNLAAHVRFKKLLALVESRRNCSLVVGDFVMNWDAGMRNEFIRCAGPSAWITLACLRFYLNGKPKFKTVCGMLDRKLCDFAVAKIMKEAKQV